MKTRTCIGCGCTTQKACPNGCSWIEEHRHTPTGVCSSCDGRVLGKLLNAIIRSERPLNIRLLKSRTEISQ